MGTLDQIGLLQRLWVSCALRSLSFHIILLIWSAQTCLLTSGIWPKFAVIHGAPEAIERHIIMHLFVDSRVVPYYVYIHEDEVAQDVAREYACETWGCLSRALRARLTGFRGRLDSDYSPSKPVSKIARLAAVAASWFSQSP